MTTSEQEAPFWKRKTLNEMNREEWESLCDGCGRCCLHKIEDEETGALFYTNVVCRLLDLDVIRCTKYAERQRYVPDCAVLDPKNVHVLSWMPETCAYRVLAEGGDLADWHPLVSGRSSSVIEAGISVKNRAVSERHAGPLTHHLLDPGDASKG